MPTAVIENPVVSPTMIRPAAKPVLNRTAEAENETASRPDSEKSLLDGIPTRLPALYEAYQITAKASRVGFDWDRLEDILLKLKEEADEILQAHRNREPEPLAEEVGDLLFVVVNVARFLEIDPETALRRSNKKFIRRFRYLESRVKEQGRELKDATLAEMDALWEEAKANERSS